MSTCIVTNYLAHGVPVTKERHLSASSLTNPELTNGYLCIDASFEKFFDDAKESAGVEIGFTESKVCEMALYRLCFKTGVASTMEVAKDTLTLKGRCLSESEIMDCVLVINRDDSILAPYLMKLLEDAGAVAKKEEILDRGLHKPRCGLRPRTSFSRFLCCDFFSSFKKRSKKVAPGSFPCCKQGSQSAKVSPGISPNSGI